MIPTQGTSRVLGLHPTTIRARLLVAFVAMVLLPATVITAFSAKRGLADGQTQVVNQLESVVTLKEAEINTWVRNLQGSLASVLIGSDTAQYGRDLLQPSLREDNRQAAYDHMRDRFIQMVQHTPDFQELFLINLQGQVILSTNPMREGQYHSGQTYFRLGLTQPYIYPLSYSLLVGRGSVLVVQPVKDRQGDTLGVLACHASTNTLNEILLERTGLGRTGETYLVDRSHFMLTESRSAQQSGNTQYIFSHGVNTALEHRTNGFGLYDNYRAMRVIGVYHWLPELQVALLAEQERSEAFHGIYNALRVNIAVAAVAVLAAVLASLFITRSISSPLADLAQTAAEIAAGDLERVVTVERDDEIGSLARAFNAMTAQLRALITSLEQRVAERTEALQKANAAIQRRVLQLETSAQVSNEVTSILNIDELLTRVVDLIRDAFGYYSVDIFLLDQDTSQLTYEVGSRIGDRKSERGMNLGLGGRGLNSRAVQINEAVMVNDVLHEPQYIADESRPDTRSELVVPLRLRGKAIGTLDVQGDEPNRFNTEDVLVLQSLGDQVAIAMENARLYDRSRQVAVLEERARLARELHDSVTQSLFSLDLLAKAIARHLRQDPLRAEEQIQQMRQITHDTLGEMRSLIFDLRPCLPEEVGLVPALRKQLERSRRSDGPDLVLQVAGERRLPAEVEKGLFRIAQEAVHNAIKHANATRIEIVLTMGDARVDLCVVDNGRGFDPASLPSQHQAFGLVGMRERAGLLGARFSIASAPGCGARVEVCIPAQVQEEVWTASVSSL